MNKKEIIHPRITSFNKHYDRFMAVLNSLNDSPSFEELNDAFTAFNLLYGKYYRVLRTLLDLNKNYRYFPDDITKAATKYLRLKHTFDIDTYTKCICNLVYASNEKKAKIYSFLIHNYTQTFKDIKEEINELIKNYSPKQKRTVLPDYKPKYTNKELRIDEKSYNILLDYFKNNPSIRQVWAFGSRINGRSKNGSDIDIIIDTKKEDIEKINFEIKLLKIHVYIDTKYTEKAEDQPFIKFIAQYKDVIPLYRKNDFAS